MKSTAHIGGHPVHPMLIPYPFALLSSSVAFDIGANVARRPSWSQTARHLVFAGLGSAVVAAVPGIVDYFGTVPARTRARRDATYHAVCNVSALVCFGLAAARRRDDGRLPDGGVALALLGTGLLSLGGWLGGELVYQQHIGVVDAPLRDLASHDSARITAEHPVTTRAIRS
jgi:uncharacterized membrane protein